MHHLMILLGAGALAALAAMILAVLLYLRWGMAYVGRELKGDSPGAMRARLSSSLNALTTNTMGGGAADAAIRRLQSRDPGFNPDAFCFRSQAAWTKLQVCARKEDYGAARSFASDGMSESLEIAQKIRTAAGGGREPARAAPEGVELIALESDRLFDAAHVRLSGPNFDEVWTFVRRLGRLTLSKPGPLEGQCPNCGAPVQLTDAGRCPACRSWLNSGEYDWVLTRAVEGDKWVSPELRTTDPGFALLGEADPEANLHFLEDRALLTFWRWQLALASGKVDDLRAVSRADFCRDIELGAFRAGAETAAGGVRLDHFEFQSFAFGKEWDEACFEARWSELDGWPDGERLFWTCTLFTFARRVGARTDPRSGLRSAHCPNCGAAQTRRESQTCDYCQTPLNDGLSHWVLCGVRRVG